MKPHFLKLSTIALCAFLSLNMNGQWAPKNGEAAYTCTPPEIDGDAEDVWTSSEAFAIDVPWVDEIVSFDEDATFKALWDDEYFYVLIDVPDDDWHAITESGVGYLADKAELYFDVNTKRLDGGGPSDDAGHYQIAEGQGDIHDDLPYEITYLVFNEASYIIEYAIPFSFLVDNQEAAFSPTDKIALGFDITVLDLDEIGNGANEEIGRVCWSNNTVDAVDGGNPGESWNTLDQAGVIQLNAVGKDQCSSSTNADKLLLAEIPVEVYPNPADKYLYITSDESISNLKVVNALGATVLSYKSIGSSTNIDVSKLSPGYYVVEIELGEVKVCKTLLIK